MRGWPVNLAILFLFEQLELFVNIRTGLDFVNAG